MDVARWASVGSVLGMVAIVARADDLVYRYEGNVLLTEAGWFAGGCHPPCHEYIENGHFVFFWDAGSEPAGYGLWISRPGDPPPPPSPFWLEWAFRSDTPFNFRNETCDAVFGVSYEEVFDVLWLLGDAVSSFSGDDIWFGLPLYEFRTFRFESLDGVNYCFFVDGRTFLCATDQQGNGYHYLTIDGHGGCDVALLPTINEWDFIRYGTISYGEQIVLSNPPAGFVDARKHAPLDRFTVTYDSPNYVYIDEITVNVSAGVAPAVIATRRLDNGPPETVEIVLDRPIPYNATTRFTFNDGVAVNTVEYSFAPGDTDGDGDADLADFAAFQNCFEVSSISGACLVFDFNADHFIDLLDLAGFQAAWGNP